MAQTAIEWLIEMQTAQAGMLFGSDIEKAKEMEKQQIMEAYSEGMGHYGDANSSSCAEKYYNEKFKKNNHGTGRK